MGIEKKRGRPKKTRWQKYSVEWVASELGVDRKALTRRLEISKIDYTEGITIREAFAAWVARDEREADRARRQKAEAEAAEIATAEKKGRFVLKTEHEFVVEELAVQTRAKVQSASYIAEEFRKRLLRDLSKIKLKA